MASSMLSGDRRFTTGRRGGMTVLGKVAVPKPINLPSQRLENHGLDPSVEIVPKGTLSWGSRSSSSSTSAWGSSTLSPNTDGGGGSPSHLSGRPSSRGSDTRPSTGGSDRSHEPNAWGSSSRPSSASGALTIDQAPATTLRPRSAETRPGSAQLSRFAEPSSESSLVKDAAGINEKLGEQSYRNDGFSLTSGDFPTLGSEKENSGMNSESQDHGAHGRPCSSGGVATIKDGSGTSLPGDVSMNVNVKGGMPNSWRRDLPPGCDDGVRPNVEKWPVDPQLYPNPQHYDAWRGPPINNHPGGVWYRRPPGVHPPYGSPVPPGGFPMEPFPYYHPQIPANPQLGPPLVAGPRGPHPKNGDMYRPHMGETYMRPGMPIRPGFYPGPMPYEGYYGPPMSYCNSNERDIPFMGTPAGPSGYNWYTSPNAPDASNSHARPSGHGPSGKPLLPEHMDSGNPHNTRGPYKVLLKHHDGWDGNEGPNWEAHVPSNPYGDKGDHPGTASWDNDRRADRKKDEEIGLRPHGEEASYQAFKHRGGGSPVSDRSTENVGNMKVSDVVSGKKNERAASECYQGPAAQDSSVFQKIESLNPKARASDGWADVLFISGGEEQNNKSQGVSAKGQESTITGGPEVSRESTITGGPEVSRRSTHGVHGKVDHRNRARFNIQEADGWKKKSLVVGSSGAVSPSHSGSSSGVLVQDQNSRELTESSMPYPQGNDERGTGPMLDPSDTHVQRAKRAELAKQRAIQRQKEEEERTRDRKAKARAKLEELNRRSQGVEVVNQKSAAVPSGQTKQVESRTVIEPIVTFSGLSSSVSLSDSSAVSHNSNSSIGIVEKARVPLGDALMSMDKKSAAAQNLSLPLHQEVDCTDTALHNNAPHARDHSSSKQKLTGYKPKENKNLDKPTSTTLADTPRSRTDLVFNAAAPGQGTGEVGPCSELGLPVNTAVLHEFTLPQRKKQNRSMKNNPRANETSSTSTLLPAASHETNPVKTTGETRTSTRTSESALNPTFVKPMMGSNDANQSTENPSTNEEGIGRVNNQLKSQRARRTPRNSQANRATEKFHGGGDAVIWAPVQMHNTEEAGQKNVVEASAPSIKSSDQALNIPKNKRAEMERYVPKPVAKEMAQQGGSLQSVAPPPISTSDETVGRSGSQLKGTDSSTQGGTVVAMVGPIVDSGSGDGRQNNKQGRGPWCQRGSESINNVESSQTSRNIQKPGHHQKHEINTVKEQAMDPEWEACEINELSNSNSAAPVLVPAVKDQGGTSKGKRHASKGHNKGMGSKQDFDHKKISGRGYENVSTQDSVPLSIPTSPKENRGVGERSASQWQPKSSGTNQSGSRPSSSQSASAEVGRPHKKDGAPLRSQQDRSGTSEHEAKREQKISPPNSTSQGRRSLVDNPQMDSDAQLEHRPTSGPRENGNQRSHFGRGHDYRGNWNSSGKDNKQHNAHWDRQRHNPQYEYQPVSSQNNSRANDFEGSNNNLGSRFRERSHDHNNHPRRGGARQSGGARVEVGE